MPRQPFVSAAGEHTKNIKSAESIAVLIARVIIAVTKQVHTEIELTVQSASLAPDKYLRLPAPLANPAIP